MSKELLINDFSLVGLDSESEIKLICDVRLPFFLQKVSMLKNEQSQLLTRVIGFLSVMISGIAVITALKKELNNSYEFYFALLVGAFLIYGVRSWWVWKNNKAEKEKLENDISAYTSRLVFLLKQKQR